ncbi:MAG: hypothetical protein K1X88_31655 [Nannocystaceae bacterium]|nr:hypothetical protein [Nannocystaceae bacterium]
MSRAALFAVIAPLLACPAADGGAGSEGEGSSGGGGSSSEGGSSGTAGTSATASSSATASTSASTSATTLDDSGSDGGSSGGEGGSTTGDDPPPPEAIAVAVGYGTRRVRSDDGITWTDFVEVDPNGGDDDALLRGVCYGDGIFLAVGGGGSGFSMRSSDGIAWVDELHTLDAFVSDCVRLGDVFVAAGGNGLRARSIDDGVSWEDESPYYAGHYRAIAASDALAVAVGHTYGDSTVGLVATTDGSGPWSSEQLVGAQYSGRGIAYGHGVFVTHDADGVLRSSSDGADWTEVHDFDAGDGWMLFADGQFITAGDGSYWTSTDGTRWQAQAGDVRGLVGWLDGHWFSLGWPATIDVSDDLASWQNVFAPGGSGLTDIAIGVPG